MSDFHLSFIFKSVRGSRGKELILVTLPPLLWCGELIDVDMGASSQVRQVRRNIMTAVLVNPLADHPLDVLAVNLRRPC